MKVVGVRVAGFIACEKVAVMRVASGTLRASLAGKKRVTVGAPLAAAVTVTVTVATVLVAPPAVLVARQRNWVPWSARARTGVV